MSKPPPSIAGDPRGSPRGPRRWGVLRFDVPSPAVEGLFGLLPTDTSGIEVQPGTEGRSRLHVYFHDTDAVELWVGAVESALRAHGLEPRQCALEAGEIGDGRWAELYQESLKPFPLGRKFRVHPAVDLAVHLEHGSPGPEPAGGRIPIRLVPGRAFGTGEHPTTRICAELLEQLVRRGSRWLDLGCGTGILALVAAHCGARQVTAVDHDPEAVALAAEVVQANGMTGTIRTACGTAAAASNASNTSNASNVSNVSNNTDGPWDGVVANIGRPFFAAHAAELASLLVAGGTLIASGFLEEDRRGVADALNAAGLCVERTATSSEWSAIVARRVEP